jgi:hypothetical protein
MFQSLEAWSASLNKGACQGVKPKWNKIVGNTHLSNIILTCFHASVFMFLPFWPYNE